MTEIIQEKFSTLHEEIRSIDSWKEKFFFHYQNVLEEITSLDMIPSGFLLRMVNFSKEAKSRKLKIACVGEFSRGKTEIINALFFSKGSSGRFLPSGTGQTTMCPVEISGVSEGEKGFFRLLPIASRSMDISIEKLKKANSAWKNVSFDKELQKSLSILTETICVPVEEAKKIGLCPPAKHSLKNEKSTCPPCGLGKVLIPKWRHAELVLPHEILSSGISILDTPGLNAIGAEPELTFGMIAEADLILFVLSIDTGVTQSDLSVWEQYIKKNPNQIKIVALNKIDMLWDELRNPEEIEKEIEEQRKITAKRLGIDVEQISTISGQKALIGKIKQEAEMVEKSGIKNLESMISEKISPLQISWIRKRCESSIIPILQDQERMLSDSIYALEAQLENLQSLKNRASEKIPAMIEKHKKSLENFHKDRKEFEEKRNRFLKITEKKLLENLSTDRFDLIISNAKGEMLSAWTTAGIVERFRIFFNESISYFDLALEGAKEVSKEISSEYENLQKRYRLPSLSTISYAIMPRRAELISMAENYERFGMMLEIAVNTQNAVVRKAFLTVAVKVRDFVVETRQDAESWMEETMHAMENQLEIFQKRSEEELSSLESLSKTMSDIDVRIEKIEEKIHAEKAKKEKWLKIYSAFIDHLGIQNNSSKEEFFVSA